MAPVWQHRGFNQSVIAGMEILQFKGMSRVLEHVHRWVEGKFYGVAQQLFGDDGSDPASAKAKLIQVRSKSAEIQVAAGKHVHSDGLTQRFYILCDVHDLTFYPACITCVLR